MTESRVCMEVGTDGVAVITISNPPVNALALPIFAGLEEKFQEAMRRHDVKAIVLTGEGGKFCGGFDINVFEKVHKTGNLSILPDKSVDLAIDLMEDGKKPFVAAIQGLALGGGLELAMACHARIAAPKAQLGLPELSLGVIPGMGGTQRLPRLVGVRKAIEMMLTSKPISSEGANRLGLVDAVFPPGELLKASRIWALDIAEGRKPWKRSLHLNDKIGSLTKANEIIIAARNHAKQTARNMPQHQACLDVIEAGIIHGGYNGCLKEAEVFRKLVASDTSKGLVHFFFSQRMTSKIPGVTDVGLKPRQVRKVAVIGGGLMGSGIVTSLILSNRTVILKEIDSEYLSKGIKTIQGNVKGLVKRGKLTPEKSEKALSLLKGVLDYEEFKDVDMVIEAVIEKISLKQSIFCDLERICPPHCILASNTSSIDLNIIGERTNSMDRVVGTHFFSPAHIMPLLEIVRTDKSSPQVILDLIAVCKAIKKVPIVVGSRTGFVRSRDRSMTETALISLTSKILSTIASPAFELAYERIQSIREARKELEELRQTIGSIQAVLLDAEKRQECSAVVKNWMERARDVLYDADDLFDEVATADLLRQQMKGNALSKKVRIFTCKLNSIVSNDSIAKKVKEIRKALQRISVDMAHFGFMSCIPGEKPISLRKEVVGAFVDPKKVIGREVEKEAVLKFLFDESKAENISVFAVVGIAGMGKTTLAQLIYNDDEVEKHFKSRWWACISDTVHEKEILEKISQSMGVENPQNYDVSQLQIKISSSVVRVRKYLLVLDDVWDIANSSPTLWLNIMSLLEYGAEGSKVVVTTRFLSVPRLMLKDKSQVFKLGGLREDKSWELFKTIAFTQEQENNQEWTSLGREIWNKCAHVPLAIRSIAATLRSKTTKKEWESIKNEKLLRDGTTMSALKLSYYHLPSYLKPCFAYCSLFPKDSLINKDELVSLWIALGYVTPDEGDTLEAAGHCYFMDFLNRSFFQMNKFSYKMHDLVHDLAENVAGEENRIIFEGSNNIQLQSRVRHLMISYKTDDTLRLSMPSLLTADGLRTFLLCGEVSPSPPIIDQVLTKLKLLRVLCLRKMNIKIVPNSVGELLHLRYLDLSWNEFESLPNSITDLVNLITLNLSYCIRLVMLPLDFCKLVSLRHLDIKQCYVLSHMPPDLEELSQLQSLSYFKVGRAVDGGKSSSLVELARLNISGKLYIDFGYGENEEVCWRVPKGITDLEITLHKGMRIPQYQIPCLPTNLVSLRLDYCPTIKYLPPLRCLPRLEVLTLWVLDELEYIENVVDGQHMKETVTKRSTMSIFFPCLKKLELEHLPKLKRWSREVCKEHNQLRMTASFPLLQGLVIYNCPELVSMPLSPQLQNLELNKVNEELIQQMLSPHLHSPSLRHLRIFKCPELKKLHNTSLQLSNLEELEIYNCPHLESWEEGNSGVDWDSLPSLRKLVLTKMPNPDILPQCLLQRQALGKLQIQQNFPFM